MTTQISQGPKSLVKTRNVVNGFQTALEVMLNDRWFSCRNYVGSLNATVCGQGYYFVLWPKKGLWEHIPVKNLSLHVTFQNSK